MGPKAPFSSPPSAQPTCLTRPVPSARHGATSTVTVKPPRASPQRASATPLSSERYTPRHAEWLCLACRVPRSPRPVGLHATSRSLLCPPAVLGTVAALSQLWEITQETPQVRVRTLSNDALREMRLRVAGTRPSGVRAPVLRAGRAGLVPFQLSPLSWTLRHMADVDVSRLRDSVWTPAAVDWPGSRRPTPAVTWRQAPWGLGRTLPLWAPALYVRWWPWPLRVAGHGVSPCRQRFLFKKHLLKLQFLKKGND